MRLLLDTHALIWWFEGNTNLPRTVRSAIDDKQNEKFVSAVSTWEIATKHRIGKLPNVAALATDAVARIAAEGFAALPITLVHGQAAGALPGPHKDPFDRMLIAQAMIENLILISNERTFDAYGVRRLW